jgi:Na+-transporting NADH:ubiquinone oxidoreductase subunit A
MVHIKVKKGLDIPIKGCPEGNVDFKTFAGSLGDSLEARKIALDLSQFEDTKFRLLVKVGDKVRIGQPLAEDKECPGRMFVSPAGGSVLEIRRGLKRRLLDIVVEVDQKESFEVYPPIDISHASRDELTERLKKGGLFSRIRRRPFNLLADPSHYPRAIFVKAIESAPLKPSAEMQVVGFRLEFQAGLDALVKLTDGNVHVVYRLGTPCAAFSDAIGVQKHTVEGPHPASNSSLHIQEIDPISSGEDVIWTMSALDVVAIGYFLLHGKYFVERIVSIAGPGILPGRSGYFKVREGFPLDELIKGRIEDGSVRLVSGDVLTGRTVGSSDFLGFSDSGLCAIPESDSRQFLSFLRLGRDKYTFSKTYLSGHLDNTSREYAFTTSLHGETRPFIDSTLYDKVMPLNIHTMQLVKAVLAEDYDLAIILGLMEVDPEDFALPSFVDPSKIEMGEIIKRGLKRCALDFLK